MDYYTLLVKEDGKWGISFGDYCKNIVIDEYNDAREQGYHRHSLQIIQTEESQAAINRAVQQLNMTTDQHKQTL